MALVASTSKLPETCSGVHQGLAPNKPSSWRSDQPAADHNPRRLLAGSLQLHVADQAGGGPLDVSGSGRREGGHLGRSAKS